MEFHVDRVVGTQRDENEDLHLLHQNYGFASDDQSLHEVNRDEDDIDPLQGTNASLEMSGLAGNTLPELYPHTPDFYANPETLSNTTLKIVPISFSLVQLKDLVSIETVELCRKTWSQIRDKNKIMCFPPFPSFSELPEVTEILTPDYEGISKFMVSSTHELSRRHKQITMMDMRFELVKAAVTEELSKSPTDCFPANHFDTFNTSPDWEDVDESANFPIISPNDSTFTSSTADIAMIFFSESTEPRISLKALEMLHLIFNRLFEAPKNESLRTLGIRFTAEHLLRQLQKETSDNEWRALSISLLVKITLFSGNLDLFLATLRWIYMRRNTLRNVNALYMSNYINSVCCYENHRVHLNVPIRAGSHTSSLFYLDTKTKVLGLCTIQDDSSDYEICVVLTTDKALFIPVVSPFQDVRSVNFSFEGSCHGVFNEDGYIVLQSEKEIHYYNTETLSMEKSRTLTTDDGIAVYIGRNRTVAPFFEIKEKGQLAYFAGSTGAMECQSGLIIPKGSTLMGIQFYLLPSTPSESSSLNILSIRGDDLTNWLTVTVKQDSLMKMITISFTHYNNVIIELTEEISPEWSSWTVLCTVKGNTTTWLIYKNASLWRSIERCVSYDHPVSNRVSLCHGSFFGFVSQISFWAASFDSFDKRLVSEFPSLLNSIQPLFTLGLNEGVGICLHACCQDIVCVIPQIKWYTPPLAIPFCMNQVRKGKHYWKPNGYYYVLTNGYESAIIEETLITWVDHSGKILDQTLHGRGTREKIYFSPFSGIFFSASDEHKITMDRSNCFIFNENSNVYSLTNFIKLTEKLSIQKENPILLLDAVHLFINSINAIMITKQPQKRLFPFPELEGLSPVPPYKSISRLLSLANLLIPEIENNDSIWHLFICTIGRLLLFLLKQIPCLFPKSTIESIVSIFKKLQNTNSASTLPLLREALDIFKALKNHVLAECVSPEYQLNLITEASHLSDVKELLVPDRLTQFIRTTLQQKMKKALMILLHRLKEECIEEANAILRGIQPQFDASFPTLVAILLILSYPGEPQWHLISIALINTLAKSIIKLYEQKFHPSDWGSNIDVLKRTAVGTVIFPVSHYIKDMQHDTSIAADSLKALDEIVRIFQPHISDLRRCEEIVNVQLAETHLVTLPPQVSSPNYKIIHLEHASNVHIRVSFNHDNPEFQPELVVSAISNEYMHHSQVLSNSEITFPFGGKYIIHYMPKPNSVTAVISINTNVETSFHTAHWLYDLYQVIAYASIHIAADNLLCSPHVTTPISKDSALRGGLSPHALMNASIKCSYEDYTTDAFFKQLAILINANSSTSADLNQWSKLYSSKNIKFSQRLEEMIRVLSATCVWHTLKPLPSMDLSQELSEVLDWLEQKSMLLLESLQQGKGTEALERAKFLFFSVAPCYRSDFSSDPSQKAESSLGSHWVLSSPLKNTTSKRMVSRPRLPSFSTRTLELSNLSENLASTSVLGSFSTNLLGNHIQQSKNVLLDKLLQFILYGLNSMSQDDLLSTLVQKTKTALHHTSAFQILNELSILCPSHNTFILNSLLHRRCDPSTPLVRIFPLNIRDIPAQRFSEHYTDSLVGCGLQYEKDLKRSYCALLRRFLSSISERLEESHEADAFLEAQALCATLCHPLDDSDRNFLPPKEIFNFLKRLLIASFLASVQTFNTEGSSSFPQTSFFDNRGFFDLYKRAMIIPNYLNPLNLDNVRILSGETEGIHVEKTNVVCMARNEWRPLGSDLRVRKQEYEYDCFANYGLRCVLNELPETQYFEVTLDLFLDKVFSVTIGVSNCTLEPLEPLKAESIVSFSSDGIVRHGSSLSLFYSQPWETGDVLGCGILAPYSGVYFTRNGEFLGTATNSNFEIFIPFIEVKSERTLTKLISNFGKSCPFKFDIRSLHSSSRGKYLTSSTMSDAAVITCSYLVSVCQKNMSDEVSGHAPCSHESCSLLLEEAALFISEVIMELIKSLKSVDTGGRDGRGASSCMRLAENTMVLLGRLFHIAEMIVRCFRFDYVTSRTHSNLLSLAIQALSIPKERAIKFAAIRCLGQICRFLTGEQFAAAFKKLRNSISGEDILFHLVELSRYRLVRAIGKPYSLPVWRTGESIVRGSGTFYGSNPLPSVGTHKIGFRIHRQNQLSNELGVSLGGCYYVGLAHGQPHISNLANLLRHKDIYVLQDRDDQDQVPHLLLKRHCIPRNRYHLIYGDNEVVWVEFNADLREITFYRGNMILIGKAFDNLPHVEDLFPIVYLYNQDASCEIFSPLPYPNDTMKLFTENFRRSSAVSILQSLHLTPTFSGLISQFIQRSLPQSDRLIENSLVALSLLGGEKSYLHCTHETYGDVVVHSVADIAGRVVVFSHADENQRLFSVHPNHLKPCFVETPLFTIPGSEGDSCAGLLLKELQRSMYEASKLEPLLKEEEEKRAHIESLQRTIMAKISTLDIIGLVKMHTESMRLLDIQHIMSSSVFSPGAPLEEAFPIPLIVDRQVTTKSVISPYPFMAMTTANGFSIIRGNVLEGRKVNFSVSVHTRITRRLLYIGVTTSTTMYPKTAEDLRGREDTWVLCNHDSPQTNSFHCCVEPRMIFSGASVLYDSGDILNVDIDRDEGLISFSRIRKGKQVDFGVLFDNIPSDVDLIPLVVAGIDTVVVFSFVGTRSFPRRSTYSSNKVSREFVTECMACEGRADEPRYCNSSKITLCRTCFETWQYPKEFFYLDSPFSSALSFPPLIVSLFTPKELKVGEYVEFEENTIFSWAKGDSVNVEIKGSTTISIDTDAVALSEPLSVYGLNRIDVRLGHVVGVPGNLFSGIQPYLPVFRKHYYTSTVCTVEDKTLVVSPSTIPSSTKTLFSVRLDAALEFDFVLRNEIFIGVTTLQDGTYPIKTTELDDLMTKNRLWGTWCDSSKKIAEDGTIFILVDATRGSFSVGASLEALVYNPFSAVSNLPSSADCGIRPAIFCEGRCMVNTFAGFSSYETTENPTSIAVGIGLVPIEDHEPQTNLRSLMLFNCFPQPNDLPASTTWRFSENFRSSSIFTIDDTVTIFHQGAEVAVFSQGILVARTTLPTEMRDRRYRVAVYLAERGLTASFVPPLYGCSHIGRIVKVLGEDVGIAEYFSGDSRILSMPLRKQDVRFCATTVPHVPLDSLKKGSLVAFELGGFQTLMHATLRAAYPDYLELIETGNSKPVISVASNRCFVIQNESKRLAPQTFSTNSTVTRTFEVGKRIYPTGGHGSYNGIIFECVTNDTIDLIGLSVLSHTTGKNSAEVFFKEGPYTNHMGDSNDWSILFSGMVDMTAESEFAVSFPSLQIKGGSFSLYINTSHNFGVGHYNTEDGCPNEIRSKLDSDGTLTVYVGQKSQSSLAFSEFSSPPVGFCGTIMYKQNRGPRLLSIEGPSTDLFPSPTQPFVAGVTFQLTGRSPITQEEEVTFFFMEVIDTPVRILEVTLPVVTTDSGRLAGLSHYLISIHYIPIENSQHFSIEKEWRWGGNHRFTISDRTTMVTVQGDNIRLPKGCYKFRVALQKPLDEFSASLGACLLSVPMNESSTQVENSIARVKGFFGELKMQSDVWTVPCDLVRLTIGSSAHDISRSSFNGIMFDLKSKQDIIIENIFAVAQTSTSNVTVRVYWKEGSMKGSERLQAAWRQLPSRVISLYDKKPFPVGPFRLKMKANHVYSLYINTTSSCGVRYFNSNSDPIGEIGQVHHTDGALTIFVGRESKSSCPFADIPSEARAFRGIILYRTYGVKSEIPRRVAIMTKTKAFITSRIMVALISFVNGIKERQESSFDFEILLRTVGMLTTSSIPSVVNLEEAEYQLSRLLRKQTLDSDKKELVSFPLAEGSQPLFSTMSTGDLALLPNFDGVLSYALVRLCSNPKADSTVFVRNWNEQVIFTVSSKLLIPIAKCIACENPCGTDLPCKSVDRTHLRTWSERVRLKAIVKNYRFNHTAAHFSTNQASNTVESAVPSDAQWPLWDRNDSNPNHTDSISQSICTLKGTEIFFEIPTSSLFASSDENQSPLTFTCPFIYYNICDAYVTLSFNLTKVSLGISFITDKPLRLKSTEEEDREELYNLRLSMLSPLGSREVLSRFDTLYVAKSGGPLGTVIDSILITPFFCAHNSCDGKLTFILQLTIASIPPTIRLFQEFETHWLWEDGSCETKFSSTAVSYLKENFNTETWPAGKSRFCTFTASCASEENLIFLELHVMERRRSNHFLSLASSLTKVESKTFSLAPNEILTIAFCWDGDLFIYDSDGHIRLYIRLQASVADRKEHTWQVGFTSVHPMRATAMLNCPTRTWALDQSPCTHEFSPKGCNYYPQWTVFDPSNVTFSKNTLTVTCSSDVAGQAALGSPLPDFGISAFIVQLNRKDLLKGASLGAGHFAGVAISTFSDLAPHFRDIKQFKGELWVVQDVHDSDSLPNQEFLGPIEGSSTGNQLFSCGTKLLFILDRTAGTLSLSRDDESPHTIFRDIPPNVKLSPFVRLDHINSSARLFQYSHSCMRISSKRLSLEEILVTQPVTPHLLREYPLQMASQVFPAVSQLMKLLDCYLIEKVEQSWNQLSCFTRLEYRLTRTLEALFNAGAFSRKMIRCEESACQPIFLDDAVQCCVKELQNAEQPDMIAVRLENTSSKTNQIAIFTMPNVYEVVGYVVGRKSMVRLLFIDPIQGPTEQTLHILALDKKNICFHAQKNLLPHPFIMRQRDFLVPMNDAMAIGVICDGWYDGTLPQMWSALGDSQRRHLIHFLICGLEHWHLHNLHHGNITPENIFVRICRGDQVCYALWDACLIDTDYKSIASIESGRIRNIAFDKLCASRIVEEYLSTFDETIPMEELTRRLFLSNKSVSNILLENERIFAPLKSVKDGPSVVFKIGTQHTDDTSSYNGIMFDIVTKGSSVLLTSVGFIPDTNSCAVVSLFTKKGSFSTHEANAEDWSKISEIEINLVSNVETFIQLPEPIEILAGERQALFIHTTNGSGVLLYSKSDTVRGSIGDIEDENSDIGVSIGKKTDNITPFTKIPDQRRSFKGTLIYTIITYSGIQRSSLLYTYDTDINLNISEFVSYHEPILVGPNDLPGIRLREDKESFFSLVYQGDCLFKWVPSKDLKPDPFPLSEAQNRLEQNFNSTLRLKYHLRYLDHSLPYFKPILFDRSDSPLGSPPELEPTLHQDFVWLSQPIDKPHYTLSFQFGSIKPNIEFCLWDKEDTLPVASLSWIPLRVQRLFLHMDEFCEGAIQSSCEPHILLHTKKKGVPIRVAFRVSKSGDSVTSESLSGFYSAKSACLNLPTLGNIAALSVSNTSDFLQEVVPFPECAVTCTIKENQAHISVESFNGIPARVRVSLAPSDPEQQPTISTAVIEGDSILLPMKEPATFFFEPTYSHSTSEAAVPVFYSEHSSIKLSSMMGTQILHCKHAKLNVVQPIISNTRVNKISLQLTFPQFAPIIISFVQAHDSKEIIQLPFYDFLDPLDECFNPNGMRTLQVQLVIDLQGSRCLVYTSSGTYVDALKGISCGADLLMSFKMSSPGSSVCILEWNLLDSENALAPTQDEIVRLLRRMDAAHISANITPTESSSIRHSYEYFSNPNEGLPGSLSHEMRKLVVGYGRILLEQTLVSQSVAHTAAPDILFSLISCTALRSSPMIASILDSGVRHGSLELLAQSLRALSVPEPFQLLPEVEASVNIIKEALRTPWGQNSLQTVFGPSLALLLLRSVKVSPKSTKHQALECAQEILTNPQCSLPSHHMLNFFLLPLIRTTQYLYEKNDHMNIMAQIGLALIAGLTLRYRKERPSECAPGNQSELPYDVLICCNAALHAIKQSPPLPLPLCLVSELENAHFIHFDMVEEPSLNPDVTPAYAVFREVNRQNRVSKSFSVRLGHARKGSVAMGWELYQNPEKATETNSTPQNDEIPLPLCGYIIKADGSVSVCISSKIKEILAVRAVAGDVITVKANYNRSFVTASLKRGFQKAFTTDFKMDADEITGLPFFHTQHKGDAAICSTDFFSAGTSISTKKMCMKLLYQTPAPDPVPPQSCAFYSELSSFSRNVLGSELTQNLLECRDPEKNHQVVSISAHDIIEYPLLSRFLAVSPMDTVVPLNALVVYLFRIQLFDSLLLAFFPLVNLERVSEMQDIFKSLKGLCLASTEEIYQRELLSLFQYRRGVKEEVTIHVMKPQASIAEGIFPTLMRSIFGQLYLQLHNAPIEAFHMSPIFSVKLAGFGSTDAGGPYRDVLSQLAVEIMSTHPSGYFQMNPLFTRYGTDDTSSIVPNLSILGNKQTHLMLEFLGKILATCFITEDVLAVEFPPLFWKQLCGDDVGLEDIASLDRGVAQSLSIETLLGNTAEELEELFPGVTEMWNSAISHSTKKNSKLTFPPETNESAQFLSGVLLQAEIRRFKEAINFVHKGFRQVIPIYVLQAFTWQKVQYNICGRRKLSFESFRNQCDIQLATHATEMFLSVLESFTDEDRALLLQFTTGQSRLPIQSPIKVQGMDGINCLPVSSTCFYMLKLSHYTSESMMKDRILYAIRHCKGIDTDGEAREEIIFDI